MPADVDVRLLASEGQPDTERIMEFAARYDFEMHYSSEGRTG